MRCCENVGLTLLKLHEIDIYAICKNHSSLIGLSHYDELHNVWITNANLEDLGAQWGAISKIY